MLASIDATRPHDVSVGIAWHGRAMVLAWGVLVPIGVIAARFFKVLPRQRYPEVIDSRVWWRTHLTAQWTSLALMGVGMALVLYAPPSPSATAWVDLHGWLGWAIIALGAAQGLSGLFRGSKGGPNDPRGRFRGDHYDMTPRRLAFERFHKTVGYSVLLLSVVTVTTGLWQANAPRWMWLVLGLWWSGLAVIFVLLQRRGMVVDTYRAIWGPDPNHPGNTRAPRRDRHHPGE
nr:cytochrome b561 domain-containing protein [Jannaschia sp. Os4]